MSTPFTKTKVLVTVMTYPHPSESHQELVCTAGITEDSQWVRLYPIDYRYQPTQRQFRKYQWIELGWPAGVLKTMVGRKAVSPTWSPSVSSAIRCQPRMIGAPAGRSSTGYLITRA